MIFILELYYKTFLTEENIFPCWPGKHLKNSVYIQMHTVTGQVSEVRATLGYNTKG